MIKLDATTKTLEVNLDSAVTSNQLPIYATYSDINTSTFVPSSAASTDTQTNDTTAVTAVSAPAETTTRKIDLITIYNADTVAADVTVQLNNNTTLRTLVKTTLQVGETLQYADGEGWSTVSKKNIPEFVNTESTLTASSTYTSSWFSDDNTDLGLAVYADVFGTAYLDFSNDGGVTVHSTYPVTGYPLAQGGDGNYRTAHVAKKFGRSWRVRFINGLTNQSAFSLVVYSGNNLGTLYTTLSNTISEHSDAQLVRTISGFADDEKFGFITGMDPLDSPTDVWAMGNDGFANKLNNKTFPSSAATLYIASDDSADISLYVTLIYNDSNDVQQEVEVQLDATDAQTAVNTGVSAIDCNRAYLSGDDETAAGNIYVSRNSSFTSGVPSTLSNTLALIPAGLGQTQQCMDRVPAYKKLWIKRVFASISRTSGAAGSADVYFLVKPAGGSWRTYRPYRMTTSTPVNQECAGLVFDSGSIVKMVVDEVSDNDTNVYTSYQYEYLNAVI